jgi:hypothetical protein
VGDKIKLVAVGGIARKHGTEAGSKAVWVEFDVDAFADQEPGTCSICGATLETGWMCLDGGEEVCREHVDTGKGGR